MTLTIELTPEQEARLQAMAAANGTDPASVVRELVEGLPSKDANPARTLKGYGALRNVGGSLDDFLREKHAETERRQTDEADFHSEETAA